jgi:hypothetical protein
MQNVSFAIMSEILTGYEYHLTNLLLAAAGGVVCFPMFANVAHSWTQDGILGGNELCGAS